MNGAEPCTGKAKYGKVIAEDGERTTSSHCGIPVIFIYIFGSIRSPTQVSNIRQPCGDCQYYAASFFGRNYYDLHIADLSNYPTEYPSTPGLFTSVSALKCHNFVTFKTSPFKVIEDA